jgi:Domain of unknown function (DUF4331)
MNSTSQAYGQSHRKKTGTVLALATVFTLGQALASSHREAPLITGSPKLDGADFYVFNSYEPGRSNYVTFVANYLPLQDSYGGPNYFELDPNGLYEIEIDNTGDAVEDITFQFRFQNTPRNVALVVGPTGNQRTNAVPVLAVGQVTAADNSALNVDQTYTLSIVTGPRRSGKVTPVLNEQTGGTNFTKPQDYVGTKTFPDYNAYANAYVYEISLPGTTNKGRVFVGQRKDPFVVNLGETFDLVNISTSPLGPPDANNNTLDDKNVTALCLELPKDFLLSSPSNPIIGAWTTANKVDTNGITQVSRLSMPLVNELVIGLKDKDKFNASEPKDDLQFVDYITHPTLPAILELLFGGAGVKAPTLFPRSDLVEVFATGVPGLNSNGAVGEMQRLNTSIPATPRDQQQNLGVLAGDTGGFPNGRRPGDDVVDIALRVVMGALLDPTNAPSGKLPFTDGATVNSSMFPNQFPYLNPPVAGSPNTTISLSAKTSPTAQGGYQPLLFQTLSSGYNATTRTLVVPKPDSKTGFLQLHTDRKVNAVNPSVTSSNLSVQIE